MVIRSVGERLGRFFRAVYLKLFRINDTPQRIAIGVGLGVFCGVIPGTGPIAALALALLFKVNRAAALLGSVLTNTWISIPIFLVSLQAGALVTGLHYQDLRNDWGIFLKDFHWKLLFDLGIYKVLGPILIGYAAVSLAIAIISYIGTLIIVEYANRKKGKDKKRGAERY